MAYGVGGLPGGAIRPSSDGIRPPVGEGQAAARPGSAPRIADGSVVEGLVVAKDGESYQVRIGSQQLNARATISLFVGQRFRAVWDASSSPPTLRLQQMDMAVLERFTGRDRQIAMALLSRGLPVKDEVLWSLRQYWLQSGGDPAKLGTLVELWARQIAPNPENVTLLSWYMELSPSRVMQIWKKIRERLHNTQARAHRTPASLLAALQEGDEGEPDDEVSKFLKAHSLAGKPTRGGLDPSLLMAPAWWPVGEGDDEAGTARVTITTEELKGRKIWWLSFELEGSRIGAVLGDVMTNGRALSVSLKLKDGAQLPYVRAALPALKEDLEEIPLPIQHLGVGEYNPDDSRGTPARSLDMEA